MITVAIVIAKSNGFVNYIVGLMRMANQKNEHAYEKALDLIKSAHDTSRQTQHMLLDFVNQNWLNLA